VADSFYREMSNCDKVAQHVVACETRIKFDSVRNCALDCYQHLMYPKYWPRDLWDMAGVSFFPIFVLEFIYFFLFLSFCDENRIEVSGRALIRH
jgi:hypothetical protein